MNVKAKILAVSGILLVLGAAASLKGLSAAALARAALALGAGAGAYLWWLKAGKRAGTLAEKPRLHVVARSALSARSGLALIEVDGQPLLVVHGDGFARIHPANRKGRRQRRGKTFQQALRSVS